MSLHISCTYLQIISEKELYFHQLLRFMSYVVGYPQQVFGLKPLILHVCRPRLGFSITWSYFQEVVTICERSSQIEKLRIPCFLSLTTAVSIQSHGYSNGSESDMQLVFSCEFSSIQLELGKSRVAPLKHVTIPCLELCGVHMLAKLLHHYAELSHHHKIDSISPWCDSTIVLFWIHTPSFCLKVYVALRMT